MSHWHLRAPAKLTWSLAVGTRRSDGFHDIDAEMLTLDLADELEIEEPGRGLVLETAEGLRAEDLDLGDDNLVARALRLARRDASVRLRKRIPLGGGLGGGSADAGAVLRWAGYEDLVAAGRLGGDVPFCVHGGRARVRGLGELVEPLEHVDRQVVLLLPPFGVDTGAAYRAFDELLAEGERLDERNHLTEAAERVQPALSRWRAILREATGAEPVLAGSGSTLFVEGSRTKLGLEGVDELHDDGGTAKIVDAVATPPSFGFPRGGSAGD